MFVVSKRVELLRRLNAGSAAFIRETASEEVTLFSAAEEQLRATQALQPAFREALEAQKRLESLALGPSQAMLAIQEKLSALTTPFEQITAVLEKSAVRLSLPSQAMQEGLERIANLERIASASISPALINSMRQLEEAGRRLSDLYPPDLRIALERLGDVNVEARLEQAIRAAAAEEHELTVHSLGEIAAEAVEASNPNLKVSAEFMLALLFFLLNILVSQALISPEIEWLREEVELIRNLVEDGQEDLSNKLDELLEDSFETTHVSSRDLVLRIQGNSKAAALARVPAGTAVLVLDSSSDWFSVLLIPQGSKEVVHGWVYGRYLTRVADRR